MGSSSHRTRAVLLTRDREQCSLKPSFREHCSHLEDVMHHLVIGEGQIGREVIARALADGDAVTVLRRRELEPSPGLRRVSRGGRAPAALAEALEGADAIQACFHAPYDARQWARDLPPRELAVLDAAAERGIPVVFPESMYGFQGAARDL